VLTGDDVMWYNVDIMSTIPKQRLIDIRPDIAKQWHPTKNTELDLNTIGVCSNKPVIWFCEKGHEWPARISARTSLNQGCPKCSGRLASPDNNLAIKFPELAKEWHPTKNKNQPIDYTPFSHTMVDWICSKNSKHTWRARISDRANGSGCPHCAGRVISTSNLTTMFPDVAKEWHPTKNKLSPDKVAPFSNLEFWWQCSFGHEWTATVASRTYQKQGCPGCSGRMPTPNNNFAVKFPEIAKEWHPTLNKKNPTEYTLYSNEKVWWMCKRGHVWDATIASRSNLGCNCPKCHQHDSKLQLFVYCELKGLLDNVEYKHRIQGMECDIFLCNYNIAVEVDAKWWHGRREEKDKIKADKLNQLGVTLISLRENGLKEVTGHTIRYNDRDDKFLVTKKVVNLLYKITNNDELSAYTDLSSPVNEDYYDSQLMLRPAPLFEKSLAYVNPKLAEQWDCEKNNGLTPSDVSANCNDKKWWKCDKGHSWLASVGSRNCHGHGCKQCYELGRKKLI
jgi:hypothetical protein